MPQNVGVQQFLHILLYFGVMLVEIVIKTALKIAIVLLIPLFPETVISGKTKPNH